MNDEPMSLRDTAGGVAVRAGLLAAGGLLIAAWITGVSLKIAGKAIHFLLLAGTGLILGGMATYAVKKHLPGGEGEIGPRAVVS